MVRMNSTVGGEVFKDWTIKKEEELLYGLSQIHCKSDIYIMISNRSKITVMKYQIKYQWAFWSPWLHGCSY